MELVHAGTPPVLKDKGLFFLCLILLCAQLIDEVGTIRALKTPPLTLIHTKRCTCEQAILGAVGISIPKTLVPGIPELSRYRLDECGRMGRIGKSRPIL